MKSHLQGIFWTNHGTQEQLLPVATGRVRVGSSPIESSEGGYLAWWERSWQGSQLREEEGRCRERAAPEFPWSWEAGNLSVFPEWPQWRAGRRLGFISNWAGASAVPWKAYAEEATPCQSGSPCGVTGAFLWQATAGLGGEFNTPHLVIELEVRKPARMWKTWATPLAMVPNWHVHSNPNQQNFHQAQPHIPGRKTHFNKF